MAAPRRRGLGDMNMTLKERLSAITGVWEGTYLHLSPVGQVLDQYASRQETRLEGDAWFERIIYRWADGREQTFDFRAAFNDAGEMIFDDPNFHGETFLVNAQVLVFPYHWKNRPAGNHVVETIVFSDDRYKSRIWQAFENGELAKVTVIVERKTDESPAIRA
jgi:hypothetical protein